MSEPAPSPTPPSPPAVRRDRSPEARRAARVRRADREQRIVSLLNRGLSVAEIAAQEGRSVSRMRALVREILARRMPQPPGEYLALQIGRLNEALLVSYSAMHNPQTGANFDAIDRVVKIVREPHRYHGFAGAAAEGTGASPAADRKPACARGALSRARSDAEGAPADCESSSRARGLTLRSGVKPRVSKNARARGVCRRPMKRCSRRRRDALRTRGRTKNSNGLEKAPQRIEKARFRTEIARQRQLGRSLEVQIPSVPAASPCWRERWPIRSANASSAVDTTKVKWIPASQ
jgi:DNA-binding CsgD family transcriptional regulator